MKKMYSVIIVALITLSAYAQEFKLPIDSTSNKISYAEVIQVPGVSKDDLYIRAREWFAKTFNSAQAVIQMDDKAAGKLIGKGLSHAYKSSFLVVSGYNIHYTVNITLKEGRYRYEISDFMIQYDPSKYLSNPTKFPLDDFATSDKYKKKDGTYKGNVRNELLTAYTEGRALSESIKEALASPPKGFKSKDDF